jgi:purine-binding chemotaxis protein CheW
MEPTGSENQLVIFGIGEQRYAVRVSKVSEIIRMVQIDPLPGSPEWMGGVVNLRGQILPVVDLRKRMGHTSSDMTLTTPIIITRDNGQGKLGMVVDMVDDMADLKPEDFEPSSGSSDLEGLAKVGGDIIMLLRLDGLLAEAQKVLHA